MVMPSSLDILLVEDNHDIAENIVMYFTNQEGHRIDAVYKAKAALALLEQNTYDVLILDVMLPDIDGFALAIKIRHTLKITTPILFLTARDTLDDKLEGFTSGGDDYLTKPFEMRELAIRTTSLVRRAAGAITPQIAIGDWVIDEELFNISYKNKTVKTTKAGFTLFKALATHHPKVVLKRTLEKHLWQDDPPDSDALRSHIFALRKALSTVIDSPVIETLHGVGFRLIVNQASDG